MKNDSTYRSSRTSRYEILLVAGIVVLCVALILSVVLLAVKWSAAADAAVLRARCEELNTKLRDVEADLAALQAIDYSAEIKQLQDRLIALQSERDALQAERDALADGSAQTEWNKQLTALQERCDALEAELNRIQNTSGDSFSVIGDIYERLCALLASPPDTSGKETSEAPDGTKTEETVVIPGWVSVYYEDLDSGLSFGFGEMTPHDSASLVKLPFALSLLEKASAPESEMDLQSVYVYRKAEDYRSGSGIICYAPDGTEYTHAELISAMLQYSDCVAYYKLKDLYSTAPLSKMIKEQGWTSMKGDMRYLSAYDAARIMARAYAFMESDSEYASLVKDAMTDAPFGKIVLSALPERESARKYGWDVGSFHEVAVVFGEHPYVIAVMSNLDQGNTEQCKYLCDIIRCIDELHSAAYAASKS